MYCGFGVSCVLGFRCVMCTGVLVCHVYWGLGVSCVLGFGCVMCTVV